MSINKLFPVITWKIVCLILIPFCSHGQDTQVPKTKTLLGRITESSNGEPIPGVTVYITELKKGGVTGIDGVFRIEKLPARPLLITISYVGYNTIVKMVDISSTDSLNIQLSEAVAEISEVVVTGLSAASELQRTPVPITTITPIKLSETTATNIIDAISMTPGINQVSTGPAISKPVIRGLGYNRVVVVNDGIRQEGQQWGDEHGIELDEYTVHKVEILKGPASLAYGSDALAGVIHFLPAPMLPDSCLEGAVLLNYQTNSGLIGSSANVAGNMNGKVWDFRISQKMAHDYQNRYDGYVLNSRFRELAASGMGGINKSWGFAHVNIGWYHLEPGLAEGDRDSVTGKFISGEVQGDSVVYTPVSSTHEKDYDPSIPRQEVNHYKVVVNSHIITGNGSVKAIAGWQKNTRQEFTDLFSPNEAGLKFDLNTFNYDFRYLFPENKKWNFSLGVNGMFQNSANKGIEFLIPEYKLFDAGIFVIATRNIKKFDFSGGIRYDLRSQNAESLFLDNNGIKVPENTNGAVMKFGGFDKQFSGWSGSLGAAVQISDALFGKINIAKGWRAPNISELGSNGEHEGSLRYEYGNSDLNPEKIVQGDLTFGCQTEHINAEVSVFANSIDDYIFISKMASVTGTDSLVDDLPVFDYQAGNAMLWGGEFYFDIHPHPLDWLHFESTFSFVNGELADQPDSSRFLPYIPSPKLVSELKARKRSLGGFLSNTYLSFGVTYQFKQDRVFLVNGTETPTDAYILLNAGAGADLMRGKRKWASLYLGISNIADVAYQNHLSRLRYAPVNYQSGRTGIFGVGRNVSIKLIIPFAG